MRMRLFAIVTAGAVAVLATAACASAPQRSAGRGSRHTTADIQFMSDMIRHHAQAMVMAGWAPTHGASTTVRTVAERVLVGQQDEIAFMERWLRERNEPVPDAKSPHDPSMHGGALMPGMLTAAQLAELDRARGSEFERLFLTFMIQHHQGAITMVEELLGAPGAAQDETVFQFAADVSADQAAEIDRMSRMLANLSNGGN